MVKKIRNEKMTLATNIEKAVDWTFEEGVFTLWFTGPMFLNMVRMEAAYIGKIAQELLGMPVSVKTELAEAKDGPSGPQVDEQVELIKQIFRGHELRRND